MLFLLIDLLQNERGDFDIIADYVFQASWKGESEI